MLANEDAGEIFAPIAMWLEAIDLVLERLRSAEGAIDLSRVAGISGAGMQHGIVCWRGDGIGAAALAELDPGKGVDGAASWFRISGYGLASGFYEKVLVRIGRMRVHSGSAICLMRVLVGREVLLKLREVKHIMYGKFCKVVCSIEHER